MGGDQRTDVKLSTRLFDPLFAHVLTSLLNNSLTSGKLVAILFPKSDVNALTTIAILKSISPLLHRRICTESPKQNATISLH